MALMNEAAWQRSRGSPLSISAVDIVYPGPNEILIKNQAWAINPIDWKMQDLGILVDSYPAIFGCDIAGEVTIVGKDVEKFHVGDRVIAVPLGAVTKKLCDQAFQLYTIAPARCAIPIPDEMQYEEAVKLPLAVLTAAAGLFEQQHLALPLPTLKAQPLGKTLLVSGGSSNVGSAAIQLAVASGLDVVAIASEQYSEVVRHAGASQLFDHGSPTIVEELVSCLQGTIVAGVFDAIGTAQSTGIAADVLGRLRGGRIASTLPPAESYPDVVEVKQVQALSVFTGEPDVGERVWENFMPQALKEGRIRPLLQTYIVGRGLESIQIGLDKLKKGVNGMKVVVLAET